MTIEKTDKEFVIRISTAVDLDDVQRALDYLRYLELTAKSTATQADADALADESNRRRWEMYREKLS